MVAPKSRAARGSRKRRDQVVFNRAILDKLLNMARMSGDKDLLSMLAPVDRLLFANANSSLLSVIIG